MNDKELEIAQRALAAAFAVSTPLEEEASELRRTVFMRNMLAAWVEINKIADADPAPKIERLHVLATVIYFRCSGLEPDKGIHPYSGGGVCVMTGAEIFIYLYKVTEAIHNLEFMGTGETLCDHVNDSTAHAQKALEQWESES